MLQRLLLLMKAVTSTCLYQPVNIFTFKCNFSLFNTGVLWLTVGEDLPCGHFLPSLFFLASEVAPCLHQTMMGHLILTESY